MRAKLDLPLPEGPIRTTSESSGSWIVTGVEKAPRLVVNVGIGRLSVVIVARTMKGRGVSFMEDRMEWHSLPLTESLYRQAVEELDRA